MKKLSLNRKNLFALILVILLPGMGFGNEINEPETELLQQYQLSVTGLKCTSCIPDVRKALNKLSGVRDAKVTQFDKLGSTTIVETVPGAVSSGQLVMALKSEGFRAEVLSVGEPREVELMKESGFNFFGLFN